MTFRLVVYIVGHLAAYVVLAIALRRARMIPAWAAWMLAAAHVGHILAKLGFTSRTQVGIWAAEHDLLA